MAPNPAEKFEKLQEIFPDHPVEELRQILHACNNNVERATNAILTGNKAFKSTKTNPRKRTLDSWLNGQKARPAPSRVAAPPFNCSSAFEKLMATAGSSTADTTSGNTRQSAITLTTPDQVYQHTQGLCELIPGVVPPDLAGRLYLSMLKENFGRGEDEPWEKNKWYLFDRLVESPHTTSFYTEQDSESSSYSKQCFEEATRYWYNGKQQKSRFFTPEMLEAREVIKPIVQDILSKRNRHELEYPGPWIPNVAAANCYSGSKQSVGPHSDVMTYLGPRATIASISLGVTRPFRLKANPAMFTTGETEQNTGIPSFNIPLVHGSLLIMHAGCQEKFKHSIPPVPTTDLFKLTSTELASLDPDDLEPARQGFRERINITFRFYRPDFAPFVATEVKTAYKGIPHCHCNVPCHLRYRTKQAKPVIDFPSSNMKTVEKEDHNYFWHCAAGSQNEGKTCSFFKNLDMEQEKRGIWFDKYCN